MPPLAAVIVLAAGIVTSPFSQDQRRANAQQHFEAGQDSMHAEEFERAVREFRAAIELDPMLVLAHYDLGQSYMALKAYPAAVKAYLGCRDAIQRLNSTQQTDLIQRDRDIDDQVHELQDAMRRAQTARGGERGNEHQVMMIQERIRVLEGMRGVGKDHHVQVPGEVYLALGSAYYRQGALAEAEHEYQEAVRLDGKLGPAHNNLAVIYMMSGRYKEARVALQRAEKSGFPVNPNLKKDLAAREASSR